MEIKTQKRNIVSKETAFSKNIEIPIETDIAVDSLKPSVASVLKVMSDALVSSVSISGQTMKIEGMLLVWAICSDDDSKPFGLNTTFTYSKNVELDRAYDGTAFAEATVSYINCRAVSGRRLEIKGGISVEAKISEDISKELICNCEDKHLKTKTASVQYNSMENLTQKSIIVEEELVLSDNEMMSSILRCSAVPEIKECKFVSGKTVVKGCLSVKIIACSEKGKICEFSEELPFTQILECKTEKENCECEAIASLAHLDVKSRTGSDGSFSNVILTARLNLSVCNICSESLEYIEDMYSTVCDIECYSSNISLKKKKGALQDVFTCRKELEFSEGALDKVLDIWCEMPKCNSNLDNNILIADNTVRICILGCDSQGRAIYHERPVDCQYRFDITGEEAFSECDLKFFVNKVGYSHVDNNKLEVRIELRISGDMFENCTVLPICQIKALEKDKCKRNVSMYIYTCDGGEQVWDIAKKYKSDENAIRTLNKIETETLIKNSKIIIPV